MRRFAAVIPVGLLLLVACTEPNTPLPDKGTAVKPPHRPGQPLLGALPAPIGTVAAADFQSALGKITSWNGGHEQKRCTDMPLCGLGFSRVPVTLEPAIDAPDADSNDVGQNGTILVRIRNNGDRKTGGYALYELQPKQDYYFVVHSSKDGPRWQLVPFTMGDTKKPEALMSGVFTGCGHYPPPPRASAAFYTCDESRKQAGQASLLDFSAFNVVAHFSHLAQFFDQSPAWVSCVFGCCTLGLVQ